MCRWNMSITECKHNIETCKNMTTFHSQETDFSFLDLVKFLSHFEDLRPI